MNHVKQVIEHCKNAINKHTRPAAVFDIDETLILNHDNGTFSRNEPVFKVYNYLNARAVPIFAVTARRQSNASSKYAKTQLKQFYPSISGLYMVNKEHDDDGTAAIFKTECRERIKRKGFTIVLNCGDNWSDLANPELVKTFRKKYQDNTKSYLLRHDNSMLWKLPNSYTVN